MDYGYGDGGAALAIFLTVYAITLGFGLLIALAVYIVSGIAYMKLFRKVGVEPWAAWVPIFNNWRLLEVGGQEGWLAVLQIVPIANYVTAVFLGISGHKISVAFRKDAGYTVLFIFLPFVWAWMLANDPAPYEPQNMTISGWKPPLAGYGSARGPYVRSGSVPPTAPPPPASPAA